MLKLIVRLSHKIVLGLCAAALVPVLAHAATSSFFNVVFSFDQTYTLAGVTAGSDSALYGTTYTTSLTSGGLIYRTTADGMNPSTLYQLGGSASDGYSPRVELLLGSDGYFYGTTHYGPKFGFTLTRGTGTVFRIKQDGTEFATLHYFADFTDSTAETNTDGAYPDIPLIEGADGFLYGATVNGGVNGTGVIYRMAKNASSFQVLHEFAALDSSGFNAEGAHPNGKLLLADDGKLYGVAASGGAAGTGTIFSMDLTGSEFQAIYQFSAVDSTASTNTDGSTPHGALLQVGSLLYGVTTHGGDSTYGTLYSVTTDGATFTRLHSFAGTSPNDGAIPSGGLILAEDGRLYGLTTTGTASSDSSSTTAYGTAYAITLDGSDFEILHIFAATDGSSPESSLIELGPGNYFGTTGSSGACGYGTVFRLSVGGLATSQPNGHSGCEAVSSGGGSMRPGVLLLLSALGMGVHLRRRWIAVEAN